MICKVLVPASNFDLNVIMVILHNKTSSRYCMVLFAGIAAEALVYGEAEGGENDENLFRGVCLLLEPPMPIQQVNLIKPKKFFNFS